MNHPQFEPKLKEIPKVPEEFGEDGGHLYKYYDALAAELDDDMVEGLKTQLDGILIFAGLFAGVNSAFLALTLPEMSADPADDTNALLLQLVTGDNSTIRSADDLPSATFAPSPGIFPVNVLFSLSLTLAILSSFLAVLGQQWLVFYRKRSGGGAEVQRREQLRRYLGAQRWHLELILDELLPGLLQLALVVFCVGFVLYLRTLSKTIYYVVTTPMAMAIAVLFLMAIIAVWDQWCPFKSPLSRLLSQVFRVFVYARAFAKLIVSKFKYEPSLRTIIGLLWVCSVLLHVPVVVTYIIILTRRLIFNASTFIVCLLRCRSLSSADFLPLGGDLWDTSSGVSLSMLAGMWERIKGMGNRLNGMVDRIKGMIYLVDGMIGGIPRRGEGVAQLRAIVAKRVLCTSEDFNALIYTGINLLAMKEKASALHLLEDDAVHQRLGELSTNAEPALASVFSRVSAYLLWGGQSAELFVEPQHRQLYSSTMSFPRTPTDMGKHHPLELKVKGLREGLQKHVQSFGANGKLSLLYFGFLEVVLDGYSSKGSLKSLLSDHAIMVQQASESLTPGWIWLVANIVCRINHPMETWTARNLRVQRERVEVVKGLIRDFGWEMRTWQNCDWDNMMQVIRNAFGRDTPSQENNWLLEQVLLISAKHQRENGLRFVANKCIDLVCKFDGVRLWDGDRPENEQKADRARCTRILSQCFRAIRDKDEDLLKQTLKENLDKLVKHLEWFKEYLLQNPHADDLSILSSWLEIQETLCTDRQNPNAPDGIWSWQQLPEFKAARPRLDSAFRAMEAAMPNIPPVDGDPRDPQIVSAVVEGPRKAEPENGNRKDPAAASGKP
ncbi:hypothetical protein FRC01_006084 [Tulasnella sp. 417]|nr:hypothetical protein FRC01_006084 [Tulasnella sp. 417]